MQIHSSRKLLLFLTIATLHMFIFPAEPEITLPEIVEQDILNGEVEKVAEYFDKYPDHIELKTKINLEGYNLTTLMLAIKSDSLPMFNEVLKRTKNVNEVNNNDIQPLIYIAQAKVQEGNDTIFAELLLQNGALLDYQCGVNKVTALMAVINSGNFNLAEFLISKKADINIKNIIGQSALFCVLEKLLNSMPAETKEKAKVIAKILIQRGIDINLVDNHSKTPLMHAIDCQDIELIEFLLDNGADINFVAKDSSKIFNYFTPILYAIFRRLNEQTRENKDKLFEIIQLLIVRKAPLKALKTDDNRKVCSPLMYSTVLADFEVVKLLVESGSDINEKLLDKTGLDYAKENYKKEIDKKKKKEYKKIIMYLTNNAVYAKNEARAMFVSTILDIGNPSSDLREIVNYINDQEMKTDESAKIIAYINEQIKIKNNTVISDLTDIIGDYIHEPVDIDGDDDEDNDKIKALLRTGNIQSINALFARSPNASILEDEAGDTPLILMLKYYAYDKYYNKLNQETATQALTILTTILYALKKTDNYLTELEKAIKIAHQLKLPEIIKIFNQYASKFGSSSASSSSSSSSSLSLI